MKRKNKKNRWLLDAPDWPLLARAIWNFLFPARCPFCNRVLGFLPSCERQRCKMARAQQMPRVKRLAEENYYFVHLEGAAAVYHYKDIARTALLRVKFGGKVRSGRALGNIMAKELFGCTFSRRYGIVIPDELQLITGYHCIVPVPPSKRGRGYHLPTLLAHSLHLALGVPLRQDALQRVRFVKHQRGLPFIERFANVAGAFAPVQGLDLMGKRVLLVDDVITTGATVSACAQALYQAGAEEVFAVSFAAADARKEDTKKDVSLDDIRIEHKRKWSEEILGKVRERWHRMISVSI